MKLRSFNSRIAQEVVLALCVLLGSTVWATTYWNQWVRAGGEPVFYQNYFEPAVMVACGKGFTISQPVQTKALEDFLWRRRDRFDCSELPADLEVGTRYLYQGAWIYLLTSVGLAWRVLGISWSGMGPYFGLLFGVTTALCYGLLRIWLRRVTALAGTAALAVSALQLANLPNLRDYAKAPFTLALLLIMGLMAARTWSNRSLLALAGLNGLILGIGYGFRTDFLVNLPVLPIVLFAFLAGDVRRRLAVKFAALMVSTLVFALVAWPVVSHVYEKGGCQWHVTLLGLQSPFDASLRIAHAPYDFGYAYSDSYVNDTVVGYARRMNGIERLPFCSHDYDVQSGSYLADIVTTFPGDMVTRAYASILQIVDLPFSYWTAPSAGWWPGLYAVRGELLRPAIGAGAVITLIALLMTAGTSVRLTSFLVFVLLYFGGYPALQFASRHHFHLEILGWLAILFVVERAAVTLIARWRSGRWDLQAFSWRRAVLVGSVAGVLVIGLLVSARAIQQPRMRSVFERYEQAQKTPLPPSAAAVPGPWPRLIEVEVDREQCGDAPAIVFRHERSPVEGDLTRTFTLLATGPGVTRIFFSAFHLFRQVEAPERPGCVRAVNVVEPMTGVPLILNVVLRPDWKNHRMEQRLADWEPSTAVHR